MDRYVRPQDTKAAQALLPDFSAGCLDADCEAAVKEWLEKCPECRQEWKSIQATMHALSATPPVDLTDEDSRLMWQSCREQLFDQIESNRLAAQNPSIWNWFTAQPRWGWAALGGAVAILGSVLLSPDAGQEPTRPQLAATTAQPVDLVMFRRTPPPVASELVNHHTAMAFDPFTDHVGSTLVSYSATANRTPQ